jgi:hypothetical protein
MHAIGWAGHWRLAVKRTVVIGAALALLAAVAGTLLVTRTAGATAPSAIVPGFTTDTLAANDDGSTGVVNLPFPIDFFNGTFNSLYVNNNGNVTFTNPLSEFTPSGLTTFNSPIIAAFWADVDTAVQGSALVTYGNGTVDGHTAFGVDWPGVDCFATTGGGLNTFQLLLINRSDIATGDFDIEFNYQSIQWDSGNASGGGSNCQGGTSAAVGYTNGSSNALELAGSFQNGAFINGGPDALATGSQNSSQPGRYIFPIRAGGGGGTVSGTVHDNAATPNPVGGALVSVCGTGTSASTCYLGSTGADGTYRVLGVNDGSYVATVSPPASSSLGQATSPTFMVTGVANTVENFTLTGPTPPPNGTVVTGVGSDVSNGNQIPVINWSETSPITTHACHGGTVTATITAENSSTGATETTAPVTLTEVSGSPGTFSGNLPAVYPLHGEGTVTIAVTGCPVSSQNGAVSFTIYIDPSGTVIDASHANAPVTGATVTLLTSDSATGTFTAVPNGSAVMSPGNRVNPSTTTATGRFGWDTVPGFYKVTATKAGCGTATSAALQVPPPALNLTLTLHCTGSATGTTTTLTSSAGPAMYGGSETLTAVVAPDDGAGTVSFTSDGSAIASCTNVAVALVAGSDKATCTTTALAAGTRALSAAYSGDGNFQGSTGLLSLHVLPATLTVKANNASRQFGAASPAFSSTISGFVLGQTLASSGVTGAAHCTTTATSASNVGPYAITCAAGTLAASNYSFAFTPGVLTITKAPTTLIAAPRGLFWTSVQGTLTRTADGAPVAGQVVTFSSGGSEICAGVTNANGVATCSITLGIAIASTYQANFAGSTNYVASGGGAPL